MQVKHATGHNAGVVKYDILTALLVVAAQGDGTRGRLALRLSLLMTARFSWRSGTFSVGQREIARLWGVTERTAKRELAQMRALGWIEVHRPAARGRVAEHRVDLAQILSDSRPHWPSVGPDFEARMLAPEGESENAAKTDPSSGGNVVPLRPRVAQNADGSRWAAAAAWLAQDNPATYHAWFAQLVELPPDAANPAPPGAVTLLAPSQFVATFVQTHLAGKVLAALSRTDPGVRRVNVVGVG
ncbi:hypothetical protein [Roseicitreum antarcticum]|uniref:DnaA N-terminal domain-containing protein n=1 Tax=Roseicitreum antarcticum TaxID=564137 RepID=A0A1H2Z872_9RHOB|nr:hypothetical protein [Roseicitreum antarcticum]SDX13064.1 hypothetical protein SAMN04488238_105266 [Roseicitreum antarcticum]